MHFSVLWEFSSCRTACPFVDCPSGNFFTLKISPGKFLIFLFFIGYFFQFVHWSVKEKLLFFRWESHLFGSHTVPKSCMYAEELRRLVDLFSVSDNQDTVGLKNSRNGWCVSDPGLLLFQYWPWWSTVLEIAPELAWERIILTWRKPTHSFLSRHAAGSQSMSDVAAPMTQSLVHIQFLKKISKRIIRQKVSAIFITVGSPVSVSASVFFTLICCM